MKWRDRRLLDLFGIEHPLVQAPMAGLSTPLMAIAASEAGGLGSIAAAMLTPETLRSELQLVQQATSRPINVNFFVHKPPAADAAREPRGAAAWRDTIASSACPWTARAAGRRVHRSARRCAMSCSSTNPGS